MKLELEQIKEKFALYSGEDFTEDSERARLCAQLCGDCAARTEALLEEHPAELAVRYLSALESWTAAEALYQLTLADEAASPERISADGVEIVEGERSQKAKALAREKRKAVLPVLGEEAFCFARA